MFCLFAKHLNAYEFLIFNFVVSLHVIVRKLKINELEICCCTKASKLVAYRKFGNKSNQLYANANFKQHNFDF